MALLAREYRTGGDYVAVRDFEYGTRTFQQGETFPWREMGLHEQYVWELWSALLLDVDYSRDEVPVPVVVIPPRPAPKPHQARR